MLLKYFLPSSLFKKSILPSQSCSFCCPPCSSPSRGPSCPPPPSNSTPLLSRDSNHHHFHHALAAQTDCWYCNRVYWLKKLTGLGSESHWRKTASSFRRDATRPMPAAALFYNPPTLALPSSGRTTSRSSWGSRSVALFSPDGPWSQILGSV